MIPSDAALRHRAAIVADKYVQRDGRPVRPDADNPEMTVVIDPEHLTPVLSFIGNFKGDYVMGGVTASEAFRAICTMARIPTDYGMQIARLSRVK